MNDEEIFEEVAARLDDLDGVPIGTLFDLPRHAAPGQRPARPGQVPPIAIVSDFEPVGLLVADGGTMTSCAASREYAWLTGRYGGALLESPGGADRTTTQGVPQLPVD